MDRGRAGAAREPEDRRGQAAGRLVHIRGPQPDWRQPGRPAMIWRSRENYAEISISFIMPPSGLCRWGPLMNWFTGPFPRPLDSPLEEMMPHNEDTAQIAAGISVRANASTRSTVEASGYRSEEIWRHSAQVSRRIRAISPPRGMSDSIDCFRTTIPLRSLQSGSPPGRRGCPPRADGNSRRARQPG
jgi:hypothetical protein